MGTLDERVAIVTGGAGNLGRAYCLGLAAEGAQVVVADEIDTAAAVDEVIANGGTALGAAVDVSDPDSVERMAASTVDAFGRIDVLINNAAVFRMVGLGPFTDITVEEWDRVMAVNVRGAWLCARAVIPVMRSQGWGRIINISSNTVWKGVAGFLHYVTSKSALIGFTRALAREVGPDGITVNLVAPDFVPDPDLNERHPGHDEAVVGQRAIARTATPRDLVGAVMFLSGQGSDFVTGQSVLVNGGSHFG